MSQTRSKYGVSNKVRWVFSAGIASGFAATAHAVSKFCINVFNIVSNPVKIGQYVLSSVTFLVTGKLIKNEFDKSNQITFGLEARLNNLMERDKKLHVRLDDQKTALASEKEKLLEFAEIKDAYSSVKILSGIKNIFQQATSTPGLFLQDEKTITGWKSCLIRPGRRFVAFGIGADLAVGVHNTINFIAPLIPNEKMLIFSITKYSITAITHGFGGVLTSKKLKIDIDLEKDLRAGVNELYQSSARLNYSIEVLRREHEPLGTALCCIADEKPAEEKKDEDWILLNPPEVDLVDDEHKPDGCVMRCAQRINRCRENSFGAFVVSCVTAGVFAPGVYNWGKIVISLATPFVPGGQFVTALEIINGAVTIVNFVTIAAFAHKKIKVNPHETTSLAENISKLEKIYDQTNKKMQAVETNMQRKIRKLNNIIDAEGSDGDDVKGNALHQLRTFDTVELKSQPSSPLPPTLLIHTPKLFLSARVPFSEDRSGDIELDVAPKAESKRSNRRTGLFDNSAQLTSPLLDVKLSRS